MANVAKRASELLAEVNHTWKLSDGDALPTESDVQTILDKAKGDLYDKGDWSTLAVGGLMVVRVGNHYDVYVRIGELDDDSNN